MPCLTSKEKRSLILNIKRILNTDNSFKRIESLEELERLGNLIGLGPLSVQKIDIQLAYHGFIEIYDDEPGNESVDSVSDIHESMEAQDLIEHAKEDFYPCYHSKTL